ncbi:MAG: choice-of-anchor D domain-containing protein [Myxococcales bacterium]|nr:choice-of-anchor D domain-containing protein [Myxococcales bacterium]MCB9553576.1 choice-of-anchor D domain-containing protein [Myxococcales bacterium]
MRTLTLLLPIALAVLPLAACDDGETLDPDAAAADRGPITGRDMRPDPEPEPDLDVAPTEADITIEPRALTLFADPGGTSEPGTLTLGNAGSLPLRIERVTIPDAMSPFALQDPPALPTTLAAGESLPVRITYTPTGPDEVRGTLTITSDDIDEGTLTLPLTGRIRQSCLRAMPSSVNVGEVGLGMESPRFQIRVVNCGDRPIAIGAVTLDGPEDFQFEIEQGSADATLAPGGTLGLAAWYRNTALAPAAVAAATLIVETDLPSGALRVNLTARGGAGPACAVSITPAQIDYDTLRISLTREVELIVANAGSEDCPVRSLTVEPLAGPAENTFIVVTGLGETLPAASEQTIVVAYAPTVPNPLGDRAELRLSYHDPVLDQNRRETASLRGVAAEALIGAAPEAVGFGLTTLGCASWIRGVRAANVGFVPICVSGYRYEGDGCDRFIAEEEPEIGDTCVPLVRDEAVSFSWRHEPAAAADEACTLIIQSDAQNHPELAIPLTGTGTDTAAVVDERVVGDLNRRQAAYFELARPALEDSLRLFVDGRETNNFGYSQQRNALVFRANNHPADAGDMIRIEYEAECFATARAPR